MTIEDEIWIAGNTTILPGISIASGSVIRPRSVVRNAIPSYIIALGITCLPTRRIFTDEVLLQHSRTFGYNADISKRVVDTGSRMLVDDAIPIVHRSGKLEYRVRHRK